MLSAWFWHMPFVRFYHQHNVYTETGTRYVWRTTTYCDRSRCFARVNIRKCFFACVKLAWPVRHYENEKKVILTLTLIGTSLWTWMNRIGLFYMWNSIQHLIRMKKWRSCTRPICRELLQKPHNILSYWLLSIYGSNCSPLHCLLPKKRQQNIQTWEMATQCWHNNRVRLGLQLKRTKEAF